MATGKIHWGWLGVSAALLGGWWIFGRGQSISREQAIQFATAYANDFVALQRSAGFVVDLVGFERAIYWVGAPPLYPTPPWAYGEGPHWFIQMGIAYTPPNAGGGENLMPIIDAITGGIVTVVQMNTDIFNWFQVGPAP